MKFKEDILLKFKEDILLKLRSILKLGVYLIKEYT